MSVELAPTPKDTVFREGTARLYRFRRPQPMPAGETAAPAPILIVPSLINRWYILDLCRDHSVVEALNAHFDTWLIDWGAPQDEDRYLTWERVLQRLARAVRRVRRETGASQVTLLGYSLGATLSGIYTAVHPEHVRALVNLAGPFDFAKSGLLNQLTDPRWFDVGAITDAGNLSPAQMHMGLMALQPTLPAIKLVSYFEQANDDATREAFEAREAWLNDHTPFPAAAYRTYIEQMYQANALIKGEHYALGQRVDLGKITCPVLSILPDRDKTCPAAAARGLNAHVRSADNEVMMIHGDHVGAVVGRKASGDLYPKLVAWLQARLFGRRLSAVQ